MMSSSCTRRSALRLAGGAAALPLVHIRTAGAAGHLRVGFWVLACVSAPLGVDISTVQPIKQEGAARP
jgi:hypothetical protein